MDSQLIIFITTCIGMIAIGCFILYNDFKHLSVKMWMLLAFISVGMIGVFVSRAFDGTFNPIMLLAIPVYFILNIFNTRFNNNKFIGQADLDIFNGTVALLVPLGILIYSKNYGELTNAVATISFGSILIELLTWLLFGFLLAIGIALVKWIILKIKNKEPQLDKTEKFDPITDMAIKTTEAIADNKKIKLKGTKIPICISFMPMYFYMVYIAITYIF